MGNPESAALLAYMCAHEEAINACVCMSGLHWRFNFRMKNAFRVLEKLALGKNGGHRRERSKSEFAKALT